MMLNSTISMGIAGIFSSFTQEFQENNRRGALAPCCPWTAAEHGGVGDLGVVSITEQLRHC